MKRTSVFLLALCMLFTIALSGCNTTTTTVISNFEDGETIEDGGDVVSGDSAASTKTSPKSNKKATSNNETNSTEIKVKSKSTDDKSSGKGTTTQNTNPYATSAKKYNPYKNMTDKEKKATVKLMTSWKLSAVEQGVLDDFTEKYGTKIKVINVVGTVYLSKLASMVASGESPDFCMMTSETFPTPIINNLVQPITAGKAFDIENDPLLDIRQMDTFKWNGKYYGVNLRNNLTYQRFCIYFNETMIKAKGLKTPYELWNAGKWNFDTFSELAKNMTETKNGKKIYGYAGEDTEQEGFILAAGVDFVTNNNGKITNNLTNKELIKVLQGISRLRANGYWNPANEGTGPFMRGEAAMCGSRTWLMEKNQAFTQTMTDKWGAVPMPSPAGSKEVIGIDPTVWCLAKNAKEPSAASYVIRYWLDYDNFDFNDVIIDKDLRRVFTYMNDSNSAKCTIARGITSHETASKYFELIYNTRNDEKDIPVSLEKQVPIIDGIIKRLKSK